MLLVLVLPCYLKKKKKLEISEREQCDRTPLVHITCGLKAKVGVVKIEASLPTHTGFDPGILV